MAEGITVKVDPFQGGTFKSDVLAPPLGFDPLILLNFLDLGVQVELEFFPIHRRLPLLIREFLVCISGSSKMTLDTFF
jgi:hypothetical protein